MDAKLKAKWVKALRSGKYKQGNCELYNADSHSYCCLGVLGAVSDVSAAEMDGQPLLSDVIKFVSFDPHIEAQLATLNDADGDWVELPCGEIRLDEGVPFDMIAGLIDEAL